MTREELTVIVKRLSFDLQTISQEISCCDNEIKRVGLISAQRHLVREHEKHNAMLSRWDARMRISKNLQ
jgi:hypothetical protein